MNLIYSAFACISNGKLLFWTHKLSLLLLTSSLYIGILSNNELRCAYNYHNCFAIVTLLNSSAPDYVIVQSLYRNVKYSHIFLRHHVVDASSFHARINSSDVVMSTIKTLQVSLLLLLALSHYYTIILRVLYRSDGRRIYSKNLPTYRRAAVLRVSRREWRLAVSPLARRSLRLPFPRRQQSRPPSPRLTVVVVRRPRQP